MTTNKKINLVVASCSFIQRVGIKTILSVIGIDCVITEIENLDDLIVFGENNFTEKIEHIILSDNIIGNEHDIIKINEIYQSPKILIVGQQRFEEIPELHYLPPKESQNQSIKILERFFIKEKYKNNIADNSILSSREIEILTLIAQGYSNKEIANNLHISINTVITHRKNITDKLDIKTIAGLTVYAIMNNYINPEHVN